jgi:hypothetical protein
LLLREVCCPSPLGWTIKLSHITQCVALGYVIPALQAENQNDSF